MFTLLEYADCQGGGVVTQSPAERFTPGSNPDLGFFKISECFTLFLFCGTFYLFFPLFGQFSLLERSTA